MRMFNSLCYFLIGGFKMDNNTRKTKEDVPVIAICYDFDKTLSPNDMQSWGYIQKVNNGDVDSFWKESNGMAQKNEMDTNLAYMYKMIEKAHGKQLVTKDVLMEYGSKIELFPGVEGWFERIKKYGEVKGVKVEHYIISSGLKEMIEGTSLAKAGTFEKIYACSFLFDKDGVPVWPAQVVNFTNKTQFLFRIEKGTMDVNDKCVNDYYSPDEYRVPFRNIIYIGDSDTDIPCMKLVNSYGGHSSGVYDNKTKDKTKVYKMIKENRIKYFAPADYSDGEELDQLVKAIIDRTVANEKLENIYFGCVKDEVEHSDKMRKEKLENKKNDLICSLRESSNFATTHSIIKMLNEIEKWEDHEYEQMFDIAIANSQVQYILTDEDVKEYYKKIIKKYGKINESVRKINNIINV